MAEFQSLLLVLVAIYAAECLVWVPLGSVAFVTWFGRRWRLRQPGTVAGNARGGFLLANPIPPLGLVVYGNQLPLSISPEGVCSWNPACVNESRRLSQAARWTRFADIREISSYGRDLCVNGKPFLKASSENYAAFLARILKKLAGLPQGQRAASIQELHEGLLDVPRAAARLTEVKNRIRILRPLANFLTVFVFAAVPVLVWQVGLRRFLWGAVAAVLAQTVAAAVLYWRAHKALLPDGREERFSWFLTMLLAAPTAMRAHDLLARHVFECFHPLALADVLLAPEAFKVFARRTLLDAQNPIEPVCWVADPQAKAAVEWSLKTWRDLLERHLLRAGLSPQELTLPPAPAEPCHVSYCPRCLTQYVVETGTCTDCGGRRLQPLPQRAAAV